MLHCNEVHLLPCLTLRSVANSLALAPMPSMHQVFFPNDSSPPVKDPKQHLLVSPVAKPLWSQPTQKPLQCAVKMKSSSPSFLLRPQLTYYCISAKFNAFDTGLWGYTKRYGLKHYHFIHLQPSFIWRATSIKRKYSLQEYVIYVRIGDALLRGVVHIRCYYWAIS